MPRSDVLSITASMRASDRAEVATLTSAWRAAAISCRIGSMIRHGGHEVAEKSTSVSSFACAPTLIRI